MIVEFELREPGICSLDPISMGLIVAGTTAAMGAATSVMGGMQAAGQANAQAKAAGNEAIIAQQQARTAQQVAAAQEGTQFQRNAMVEGSQLASIAQSGTGVTSVSAQNVMRQTAINDQLDALNIRYQGQLQAHDYGVQAQEAQTAQGIYKSNAQNALMSGYIGAGSALLSTGTSYAKGGFGMGSYGAGSLAG